VGVYAGVEPTWAAQTNVGRTHIATKGVVQSGLVLNLDAGVSSSYSGSGTTWTDLSGNGNTGTLTNGPTYNSSNGGSIVFDGSNDYVTTNSFNGDSNSALSVFCWVYPTNLTSGQDSGNFLNWIINKRNTTSPNSNSWQLCARNSYPLVNIWDNNDTLISEISSTIQSNSLSTFQLNKWQYTGFVTDGTNNGSLKIYINDKVNYSGILTGNRGIESKPIDIGVTGWSKSLPWVGNIAQVSIYNKALTAAEIQQNFNATRGRFGI
jgi:hypothetical protein